jgi:hypothetical protein
MKKSSRVIIFLITIFIISSFFSLAYATEGDYVVLTPLPGITDPDCVGVNCTTTLERYLPQMFNLIIGIAAVLAFIVITFGGVTYATSDALQGKQDGKAHIENGIYGLLLVIGAWVILNTINPQLLDFRLFLPKSDVTTSTGTTVPASGGIKMTAAEISADSATRTRLQSAGVAINATPCTEGQGFGCTNLNGLPEPAVQGLISLKSDCGCEIVVTGGTEPGPHKTHGVGKPMVDLRYSDSLNAWLKKKKFVRIDGKGANITLQNGRKVYMVYESAGQGNSTGAHWHVVF